MSTRLNRTYSSPSLGANTPAGGRKTFSSPKVKGKPRNRHEWECQKSYFHENDNINNYDDDDDDEDDEFYVIGDRVFVDGFKPASVAYFGEVEFAPGDWVGVVMDNPLGNHNGKVHGREYFQCAPFHGLFVRPHRVTRMQHDSSSACGASGRVSTTPLPTLHQYRPHSATNQQQHHRSYASDGASGAGIGSPAASSVTTDSSYFYDDDYRQSSSRLPTIASLGQKMDEIEANSSRPESRQSSSFSSQPTTSPVVGILKKKHTPSMAHSYTMPPVEPRSRSETRQNYQYNNTHDDDPKVPVFNFRPRRARLDQQNQQQQFDSTQTREVLSDMSNTRAQTPISGVAGGSVVDLSSEPEKIGDRVWVRLERGGGDMSGVLRFMGETNFATGEWAGVELDRAEGKNDGSVLGYRYFYCPQNYGLFVPATRVRKQNPTDVPPQQSNGFKAMRSTLFSPPPPTVSRPPLATNNQQHHYDNISYNGSSSNNCAASNGSSRSMTPMSCYSSSSNKTTPSPAPAISSESRAYHSTTSSNSGRISPSEYNPDEFHNCFAKFFDISDRLETPKFDDKDIDYQLMRSLGRKNNLSARQPSLIGTKSGHYADDKVGPSSSSSSQIRPRCVKYTFSSSKYDGNPIARRTVEYD